MQPNNHSDPKPVQPAERIKEIDIIRGLALFGILMVNMSYFKYPIFFERYPSNFPAGLEQFSAIIIQFIFTGKFYAIFSFLFGLGFYIFMERTLSKGFELVPLYRRRLFALLLFGAVHLVILWTGDILFTYALVGFLLLKFRDKSREAIGKWIIGLFITTLILYSLFGLINGYGEYSAGESYQAIMSMMINGAIDVYTGDSFGQLILFRVFNELPYVIISMVVWIPAVLAFFLCGLYAGKTGIFKDIGKNIPLLTKIRNRGLAIGAVFMLIYGLIDAGFIPVGLIVRPALLSAANYTASIFLFPAYISLVLIALQSEFWKKILSPVAAAGRMALTNYLAQTLICMIIFYGCGFGFFGQVTLAQGVLITIAIYLVQVIWSNLWFKKFRYGQIEWIWRMMTYKNRQPLRNRD